MITVSDKAIAELKIAINEHKQDSTIGDIYVRIAVIGGGCSGFKWNLTLEENSKEKDQIFDISGVKFVIDPRSGMYCEDTRLDFIDNLNHRGFKFSNPSIKTTCGCGQSFSY